MESAETTPSNEADLGVASLDDVANAVELLTETELVRLTGYAKYRMRGLGRRSGGRDHEDLMKEAITLTLSGQRRWKPVNVTFDRHLIGVMRSISSHWAEQLGADELWFESELTPGDSTATSPLQRVPSVMPEVDTVLSARQELDLIYRRFKADAAVLHVLEGLKEGMTAKEVQEAYAMPKNDYESAMKRLRRAAVGSAEVEQ
jgi:hypothetical protein